MRENPNYNWQLLLQSWVDKGAEVDDKLEIANMDSSLIRLLDICEFSNKFLDRLRYDLQVSNVDYTENHNYFIENKFIFELTLVFLWSAAGLSHLWI